MLRDVIPQSIKDDPTNPGCMLVSTSHFPAGILHHCGSEAWEPRGICMSIRLHFSKVPSHVDLFASAMAEIQDLHWCTFHKKTEAQRGELSCLKSHSVGDSGFKFTICLHSHHSNSCILGCFLLKTMCELEPLLRREFRCQTLDLSEIIKIPNSKPVIISVCWSGQEIKNLFNVISIA